MAGGTLGSRSPSQSVGCCHNTRYAGTLTMSSIKRVDPWSRHLGRVQRCRLACILIASVAITALAIAVAVSAIVIGPIMELAIPGRPLRWPGTACAFVPNLAVLDRVRPNAVAAARQRHSSFQACTPGFSSEIR